MKKQKPKKCKNCGGTFNPFNSLQKACSPSCALTLAVKKREKKEKKQLTVDRREFKLNDKKTQKNLAWKAFSRFIRLRDKDLGCISCGTKNDVVYAAGHFRSRGAIGALMFHEDNVHKQCNKYCNKELSSNYVNYKPALIEKIGLERVEWLEGHHEPKQYTVQDLVEIKLRYLKLCREMEAS